MFFNKRKKFNGSVAVRLPAFEFDMEEFGEFKLLSHLDIAWRDKYNQYEAALFVAYRHAFDLYRASQEKGQLFIDKMLTIQSGWVKKGLVEAGWAVSWSKILNKNIQEYSA